MIFSHPKFFIVDFNYCFVQVLKILLFRNIIQSVLTPTFFYFFVFVQKRNTRLHRVLTFLSLQLYGFIRVKTDMSKVNLL